MTANTPTYLPPDGAGRTALVIGATGGLGAALVHALTARGWRIRALHRRPDVARNRSDLPASVDWIAGNAMLRNDVAWAARGADVIVHAANPPGYRDWRARAIPMLANTIDAARHAGARILFPGNIYNFGPDAWPVLTEDAPQHPVSRKGAVRVEMEAMLAAAAERGVRILILRAGDYFGPHAPASWLENVMVKPGRPLRSVTWPGDRKTGHAFAYLPDLAEAAARLLDLDEARLAPFETVNFGGHWVEPGIDFAHRLAQAAGRSEAPVRRLPWWLMRLAAPFAPTLREALEMRYLWRNPVRLHNAKLTGMIGEEPHTPLDVALRETVAGLGVASPADRSGGRIGCVSQTAA